MQFDFHETILWFQKKCVILHSKESVKTNVVNIKELLKKPEGRRLEFKSELPEHAITTGIATQAEEAYNFVLRHINKGATVEGIYTVSQWEYPIKAVREAIRNAVVHRDYSLTGKDVKVAIYDDMIEITSPGLLPPSIDFSAMESRQSDARNKVIAPVFKRLGIIDQWGNGLKLISDEMKAYPKIGLHWRETGLSFQIQFVKLDFVEGQELGQDLQQELGQNLGADLQQKRAEFGADLQQERAEFGADLQQKRAELGVDLQQKRVELGVDLQQKRVELGVDLQQGIDLEKKESRAELRAELQELRAELKNVTFCNNILLQLQSNNMTKQELADALSFEKISGYMNRTIKTLLNQTLIERTIPQTPNHPLQKFRITQRGKMFLELLTNQ